MKNVNRIRVIAHTSSDGSGKMNMTLSKDRARQLGVRIREDLKLKKGIVTIRGMGETQTYIKQNSTKWDTRYEIELQ